jgi:hypothetical protein
LHTRTWDSETLLATSAVQETWHRPAHRKTRNETPATFPDTVDKLPEMTDQQPQPLESTVLRQLPHTGKYANITPVNIQRVDLKQFIAHATGDWGVSLLSG